MGDIIVRKDKTSISCCRSPVHNYERKMKRLELTIAIVLIVTGSSIILLVH